MEHISVSNPDMESLRRLFSRNALALRNFRKWKEPDLIKAGVPGGSAHRGTTPEGQNMCLETVQKWAKALKTPAWTLLHPAFDPQDPLVTKTEAQIEAEVERRFRERIRPLGAIIGGLIDQEEAGPDGSSLGIPKSIGSATTRKPSGEAQPHAKGEATGKGRRRA